MSGRSRGRAKEKKAQPQPRARAQAPTQPAAAAGAVATAATTAQPPKAAPAADELALLQAPEEFRRAITRDPFASSYRFDFDAARGPNPIDAATLPIGGDPVPRDGYYFDLDGGSVSYHRAGTTFPKYAPIQGAGGHYLFVTDNRNATTSDLLWIILKRGWDGNVLDIFVQNASLVVQRRTTQKAT